MRDILLTLIISALLVMTFKRAEIGAYLWAWLSLMNPHQMTYGFGSTLPWALAAAMATLLSFLFSKTRKPLPVNGGVAAMLLLWAWMVVTSVATINPAEMVWDRFIFVSKIYLMLLVTLMLVRGRKQIDTLVWIVVVSIGYFGLKGGIFTLLTGGSYTVWGPPSSMLEENNALAVALIVVLPLMYYLRQTTGNRWVKMGLGGAMLSVGISILGSQSRGALIGLLSMALVLGSKSKNPIRFSLLLALLIGVGISFMPDTWTTRMDSIQTYSDDTSAMSRLYTWRTLWNVAIDRPLVGAGFRADTVSLFAHYAPRDSQYDMFQGQSWVAHSIYMQALGEHGFVGLALYILIWISVWVTASRVSKQAERLPELKEWVPILLRMCQVSTVGFCAGGAFLSLMNLDLPFYILAFVTLCQCAVNDQLRQKLPVTAPLGTAGSAAAGVDPVRARPALPDRH